jgi:hypothetical protein
MNSGTAQRTDNDGISREGLPAISEFNKKSLEKFREPKDIPK